MKWHKLKNSLQRNPCIWEIIYFHLYLLNDLCIGNNIDLISWSITDITNTNRIKTTWAHLTSYPNRSLPQIGDPHPSHSGLFQYLVSRVMCVDN